MFVLLKKKEGEPSKVEEEDEESSEDDDENYLHPLLSQKCMVKNDVKLEIVKDEKVEIVEDINKQEDSLPVENKNQQSVPANEAIKVKEEEEEEKIQSVISAINDLVEPEEASVRQIIDSMAVYVNKNGMAFEMNIKKRNEERFNFLNEDHIYHNYYKSKIAQLQNKKDEKTSDIKSRDESVSISSTEDVYEEHQNKKKIRNKSNSRSQSRSRSRSRRKKSSSSSSRKQSKKSRHHSKRKRSYSKDEKSRSRKHHRKRSSS